MKLGRSFFLILTACMFLLSCTQSTGKQENTDAFTWSHDIAPIIHKNCSPCHRTGQSGPINLITYRDVAKKGSLLRFVTQNGYMPPWPADPSYSHFTEERVLSEEQKNMIKLWVEQGMPRGDSLSEPAPPVFNDASYFGNPDLTIKLQEAVKIKGDGEDAFLILKFPFEISTDTIVDFVEFVPGQRKLVHHVNGHLVNYDAHRTFNYQTGACISRDTRAQVMDVYRQMHIPYTDGKNPSFPTLTPNTVYYLPGYVPPNYPEDVGGFRLKKNGLFLLNNIHYGPSNKDLLDSSYINVFFRKKPVKRPLTETQLGTFGVSPIEPEFIIPPNEVKTFHTSKTIPFDISMVSVNPHMHLIGKTFRAFAIKPNGDTIPIIRINKWDFRWQYYYTFNHPLKIEKGSTIHVYGTFDNTNGNINNPFHPPRTITQGNGVESMKTTEEMFQFIFTYMPYKPGDEKIDLRRK